MAEFNSVPRVLLNDHPGDRVKAALQKDARRELCNCPVGDDDMITTAETAVGEDPEAVSTIPCDAVALQVDRDVIGRYCDARPRRSQVLRDDVILRSRDRKRAP